MRYACNMREPKTKTDLPRWLASEADFLENLIHYGKPDTPERFFQDVAVRETMQDVRRVCARHGIDVAGDTPLAMTTDPREALIQVGRLLDQLNPQPDLLTVKQVAEQLNVSPRTVYDLVESGRLRCSRVGKERGTIRIRPEDLDRIVDKSTPATYKHLTI